MKPLRLRKLTKAAGPNDGTRSLGESIMVPELRAAIKDWQRTVKDGTLIGGLAFSFYAKPRTTMDIDFLFLSPTDIPDEVPGFKRTRKSAYQHNRTHVEIETVSPQTINMSPALAAQITKTAITSDGIMISSPDGLVAAKLGRASMRDKADIVELIQTGKVGDLHDFPLTDKERQILADLRREL